MQYVVGSSSDQVKPKTVKLVFVASPLSMEHYKWKKSKDWLAWNQDNESEWYDISTCALLFQ